MSAPRRRYRAPQEDGAALFDPPLAEVSNLVKANRNRELPAIASAARGHLVRAAMSYSSVYRDMRFVPALTANAPIILSGHQPELFHAGVWLKTFLLSAVAKCVGGVGINLIVDNDTPSATALRVPTQRSGEGDVVTIPYDKGALDVPYEERAIEDRPTFLQFGYRVQQACASLLPSPLIERIWPEAIAAAKPDFSNLGMALAAARHGLEATCGLSTLEVPLSRVCSPATSSAFAEFTGELIVRGREFHEIYNECLSRYRLVNRVRNRLHPVPDLGAKGEWLELPFWIWTKSNPRRQRLFAAIRRSTVTLSDHGDWQREFSTGGGGSHRDFAFAIAELEQKGVKLRPRALITTMYARLVLSDLFIHGIGGAKYDELTDEIIRRFFGIEPPKYITATATFRLPIDRPHVSEDDLRASARQLRDVRYRPEALLSHPLVRGDAAISEQLAALAGEKREYLARHNPRRAPEEVFASLDRLNRAMHALLAPVEAELKAAHARLIDDARKSALLGSREFSFVLFSEELPARLLALCRGVA